ncbi:MAG: hypothetical protein P4M02_05925, partial [Clostridia bacterium]|nr:hypothetical protein [Clostridia bacterium]
MMAQSQRSIYRFVGRMLRNGIPQSRWNGISRESADIRVLSNTFNFCLLTEQVVGLLATLAAYGAVWAVNFFIVRGYFGSEFLHTNTEAVKYLCECVAYVVYMFIPFILITYVLHISPVKSVNARKIARPWLLLVAVPTVMSFYFAGNFFTDIVVELLRLIHLNPVPPSMLET